jgi:hypothetical protein
LLGTLFSTLAALAFVRNRAIAAGVLAFGAFLSKEEVLALPVIFTIWSIIDKTDISARRARGSRWRCTSRCGTSPAPSASATRRRITSSRSIRCRSRRTSSNMRIDR